MGKTNFTSIEDSVVYNEDLGLACEKLPQGLTLDSLWKIV